MPDPGNLHHSPKSRIVRMIYAALYFYLQLDYLDEEMQSIREMCQRDSHIRRALLENTLEVHPMGDYGALEIGVHRFYHTNPGQSERASGTYKFIHIWKKMGNPWKISRVISYDHRKMNND